MISLRAAKNDDLSSIPGTHTLEVSQIVLLRLTPSLSHTHAYKPKRLALSPTKSEHSKPSCLSYGDDSAEPPGGLPRCALAQPLRCTHRRRRLASSSRLKEKKKEAQSSVPRPSGTWGYLAGTRGATGASVRPSRERSGERAPGKARQARPIASFSRTVKIHKHIQKYRNWRRRPTNLPRRRKIPAPPPPPDADTPPPRARIDCRVATRRKGPAARQGWAWAESSLLPVL